MEYNGIKSTYIAVQVSIFRTFIISILCLLHYKSLCPCSYPRPLRTAILSASGTLLLWSLTGISVLWLAYGSQPSSGSIHVAAYAFLPGTGHCCTFPCLPMGGGVPRMLLDFLAFVTYKQLFEKVFFSKQTCWSIWRFPFSIFEDCSNYFP